MITLTLRVRTASVARARDRRGRADVAAPSASSFASRASRNTRHSVCGRAADSGRQVLILLTILSCTQTALWIAFLNWSVAAIEGELHALVNVLLAALLLALHALLFSLARASAHDPSLEPSAHACPPSAVSDWTAGTRPSDAKRPHATSHHAPGHIRHRD